MKELIEDVSINECIKYFKNWQQSIVDSGSLNGDTLYFLYKAILELENIQKGNLELKKYSKVLDNAFIKKGDNTYFVLTNFYKNKTYEILIDPEDINKIKEFKWMVNETGKIVGVPKSNSRANQKKNVKLACLLLNVYHREIYFKNFNNLDYRKNNLTLDRDYKYIPLNLIKVLIEKRKQTNASVAKSIGVSEGTVRKWCNFEINIPISYHEKLSKIFCVPSKYFYNNFDFNKMRRILKIDKKLRNKEDENFYKENIYVYTKIVTL